MIEIRHLNKTYKVQGGSITALDDINVDRFADYMSRSDFATQFICITHRRGTMEAADMLYGVTMQEKGISKLLELNVAELEKHLPIEDRR